MGTRVDIPGQSITHYVAEAGETKANLPVDLRPGSKGFLDDDTVWLWNGFDWVKHLSQGSLEAKLPENVFGIVSAHSVANNSTEVSFFSNGLEGVTIENFSLAAATQGIIYAAFNNHAMSDATLDGMRFEIGPNSAKPIPFPGTPKPTQMTIVTPAGAGVTGFYTAAESIL